MKHPWLAGTCALLLVAGCTVAPPPTRTSEPKPKASTVAVVPTTAPVLSTSSGQVLGLDGKPAAGVKIKAFVISTDGASLITNDGGGYALLAATPLETTTDAKGGFKLDLPAGKRANVEAVLSDDVKAIQLDASTTAGLVLNLDHTGTIAGKVVPPPNSTATNMLGVDVYIPGTGYAAKTDAEGAFTLANVPVGSFKLVASKTGLGLASGTAVVKAKGTASVDLALVLDRPTITSLSPAVASAGGKVTIKGSHFGASTADPFSVAVAGATIANPTRVDDQTIEITLPENVSSGDVVVTVAGTPGPATKLVVAKALAVATAQHDLWVGSSLPFKALAVDVAGKLLADAPLTWAVEGAAIAVDATGVVTAKAEGTAKLTVSAGTLTTSVDVAVHAEPFITTIAGSNPLGLGGLGGPLLPGPSTAQPTGLALISVGPGDGTGVQVAFGQPWGVVPAPDGTLYLAEAATGVIRKIQPDGTTTTLAGHVDAAQGPLFGANAKDGKGDAARFSGPHALALDAQGNLLVADYVNCKIRKVTPDGAVTTLAGSGPAVDITGAGGAYKDGPAATAQFAGPSGLAVAPNGDVYIADTLNHLIRKLTPDGQVSTFAGSSRSVGVSRVGGYVDGTGTAAMFSSPGGLAFDKAGNLYVADTGNGRIRKITSDGAVTTLAGGGVSAPNVDPVQFKDAKGAEARFSMPQALAFDLDGNLLVADRYNGAIRVVTPDGTVSTLLGPFGSGGFPPLAAVTDGPLASASLGETPDVAVGADGTIYVTDFYNGCVRAIVRKGP